MYGRQSEENEGEIEFVRDFSFRHRRLHEKDEKDIEIPSAILNLPKNLIFFFALLCMGGRFAFLDIFIFVEIYFSLWKKRNIFD